MIKALSSTAIAVAVSLCMSFSLAAQADTLDFFDANGNTESYVGGTTFSLANATITTTGADLYIGSRNNHGDRLGTGTITPVYYNDAGRPRSFTEMNIEFNAVIENLYFEATEPIGFFDVNVSAYNDGGLVGSLLLSRSQTIADFSSFGLITSLVFTDGGNSPFSEGSYYGNFSFDVANISAVPLPAAFPLFGAALIGIGLLSRRKKHQANMIKGVN